MLRCHMQTRFDFGAPAITEAEIAIRQTRPTTVSSLAVTCSRPCCDPLRMAQVLACDLTLSLFQSLWNAAAVDELQVTLGIA